MNPVTDSCTGGKELQAVLAPYMKQPFATPHMVAAGLQYLLAYLREYARRAEQATDCPRYLPVAPLARRYGMTPKGIAPYLLRWSVTGDVQKIAPIHPVTGRAGVPRYCVEDVDRMMTSTPKPVKS